MSLFECILRNIIFDRNTMFSLILVSLFLVQCTSSDEYLGSTSKHLFHFIHITDIHVSHFGNNDRIEQFEQFCNETIISLIQPKVTIVSGDLVHNRDPTFGSEQYEQEWIIYKNILNRTNVTQYTQWLDMRGNHDNFMDADPISDKSFYRIYSNQGPVNKGSYQYTLTTNDNDTYSFVGIDMCPRPGAGRPFDFLGYINHDEMENIKTLAEQTKHSNTTILFGHYPLSFAYSRDLVNLMNHAIVYLNGHLHQAIKHLYARHADGLLELELADWKDNRRFRIITIDAGMLSFEDVHFNQPIYGVISNPKSATFKTLREPLIRLSQSTHIRIVIFSKHSIVKVRISIDSKYFGDAIKSIDNEHLYVLAWNASAYNDRVLHDLTVEIQDNQNNTLNLNHQFSLSTTIINVWTRSKFMLHIHWPTFGMLALISTLCIYILILIYYRYRSKRMTPCCTGCFSLWNKLRLRMMILCSIDFFCYSLIGLAIYHFIGPWYIGYLTDGHFGVVFLWGTILRGIYLPPDMQTYMGTIQLVIFLFPLTYGLSSSCYYRYHQLQTSLNIQESRWHRSIRIFHVYIVFIYSFLVVLVWSLVTTASYKFAWILSPFGISLSAFALVLYIKTRRLKREDFQFQTIANLSSNETLNDDGVVDDNDQRPIVFSSRRTGDKDQ